MVQLVLDHVDQQPVVDEVIVVARGFAVGSRLDPHPAFDELVTLEGVEDSPQLLPVELEELQHVLLLHAGVPDEDVQSQSVLDAVKAAHHILGEAFESCWHLSEDVWVSHSRFRL